MKKKIGICIIILSIIFSSFIRPTTVEAKTIKEFEAEVEKFTKELEIKKANLAKNDTEVKEIKNKIASIEKEIKAAKEEVIVLGKEIEESEEEIKRKIQESKDIIAYYQMSSSNNYYLEYVLGAENITDMIYRLSIVEQLTEYNEKIMKELEDLIERKHQRQEELKAKQETLKNLEVDLNFQKARIEQDSELIRESMPSIETQIKAAKESVEYYKKLGCGKTEDIQACEYRISQASSSSLPSVGFFSRPIENGYLVRGMSSTHKGYDFSSNNKSIGVYPIAAGVVHKIYRDSCSSSWCNYGCNGNAIIVVVKHNYNGRYIYSSYVHLRSYSVREGQFVSSSTLLGYMGSTGCSTGPHLHLEVADCFWQNGGCNYSNYVKRLINPSTLFTIPSKWNNR